MRVLEAGNRVRTGLIGVILTVLVTAVGQSFASVPMLFAEPIYYAQFTNSAGLKAGDIVRLNGMDIGVVEDVTLDDHDVRVAFTLAGATIGTDSGLAIRTDTILGKRVLEITPRGTAPLRANEILPLDQSTNPYQIYDAFTDLTKSAEGWDIRTVKESLDVLSQTISAASPQLSAALDGVARFSDTIGKRDERLDSLLANANRVAGVLGNRSEQVNQLLVDAHALLAKFNERQRDIDDLLGNVSALSAQVEDFVMDNPNLNRVLEQLRVLSTQLVAHKQDLNRVLSTVSKFSTSIAEAVGSGPYFKVMVANLVPYQILQPFVDAAFKKRGIDPQEFWRDAGLPAFRFPDPNGFRLPNGAPPPAPAPMEGTPEFPGPAVPKGSPCSYTPPADGVPSPQNPLPCAGLTVGPFGDNPYGANYGPPNVAASVPNPNAGPPAPGVPSAAIPGQVPPDAPGVPVPLAPGPPGARTVPLGPPPGPPLFVPPDQARE